MARRDRKRNDDSETGVISNATPDENEGNEKEQEMIETNAVENEQNENEVETELPKGATYVIIDGVKYDKTPVTRSVVNLDTFGKVVLGKRVPDTWSDISNTAEALAAVGNKQDEFLKIIKEGLRAKARRESGQDLDGFRTFDSEGELNGDFNGSMGHPKVVNAQVLTMAKMSIEGDWAKASKTKKQAARKDAEETIRSVPKMLESMKRKSAEMFAADEADSQAPSNDENDES